MRHDYTIQEDRSTGEFTVIDGDGTTVYTDTPSYGSDYKRVLADAMLVEYNANGFSDRLVEMMYVAYAETWSIETV